MTWSFKSLIASAIVLTLATVSHAAPVTVGNVNSGEANAFPFGGAYQTDAGGTEYQQVYLGSLFGSSVYSITSITFYAAETDDSNADGTYTLSLSTTSAAVDGLSTTMANNIGADNTQIFSGALPTYGPTMTFQLAQAFNYDPSQGNLLLDVKISGVTNDSTGLYISQNGDFGGKSSRMVNGQATSTSGWGLVTTFNNANAVPEPGAFTLLAMAVPGVLAAGWRRRARAARA